jgi:hypothetical protein
MYIIDYNGVYNNSHEFVEDITGRSDCAVAAIEEKTSESFQWDDDLLINKINCPIEAYEKYFE